MEAQKKPEGDRLLQLDDPLPAQVTPILFKMQDEDGIIRTFDKIHVNHSEKKLYAGIPSYEFDCDIFVNGLLVKVLLQYFPEDCRWTLCETG